MSIRKHKIRIYAKFHILKFGEEGMFNGEGGMFKVNKQMWTRMTTPTTTRPIK